jgi:hypothetical protein
MAFKLPKSSPFKQETDKPKNSFADNSFFTDNMRSGFGAGEYGTFSNPSFDPQTYASEGMGEGIASAGDAIADAIASKKRAKATSEDRPDMTNKHKVEKPRTLKEGASPDLDSKIQTAKSRGNLKRAARLEGRQERRIERQTEGAERVKARQAKKTAKAKTRQENKTKKSIDTSVDGGNLQMKNDSPNKFMGGIAGAAGQIGMKNSSIMSGFLENNTAYQMAMERNQAQQATQAQQAAAASSVAGGTMGTAAQNPMTGGAMDQANPFEGKTFQITPANMMGNAKPVFSEQTQGMAETAFGSGLERQMSMPNSGSVTQMSAKQEKAFGPGSKVYEGGNTAIYEGLKAEDNSPAASYENPKTVIDDSHGYVARKAAEAFGQVAEKLIEKKKGEKDENE